MGGDLERILGLEIPLIVNLGRQRLAMRDILGLVPGAILELDKSADEELDLLVNNKKIGTGRAVKVGENFGLRITAIGGVRTRVEALGQTPTSAPDEPEPAAA